MSYKTAHPAPPSLLAGLLVIVPLARTFLHLRISGALKKQTGEDLKQLEEREWKSAENALWSTPWTDRSNAARW